MTSQTAATAAGPSPSIVPVVTLTVATKPAFRSAFKNRRWLVLADGYVKWLKDGKAKLHWLYDVNGGTPFAFAGLW